MIELGFPIKYLLLFGAGVLCGIINVLAGAGSVLTIPALIFFGLPADVANGTNRLGIIMQSLLGVIRFSKKVRSGIIMGLKLTPWTIMGAVLGSILGASIKSATLQTLFAVLIIFLALLSVFREKLLKGMKHRQKPWYVVGPLFIAIGFYAGVFQAGVGLLLISAISWCMKDELLKVNAAKLTIIFVYLIPSLFIYGMRGKINLLAGLVLAAGTMSGAYIGTHLAFKKGSAYVKYAVLAAVVFSSLKLFGVI